jgi:uncharacterized membrane protein HdeD (DUF308 family)
LIFRSGTEPANEVKRCLTLRGASTVKFRIPAANLWKAGSWFIGEAVVFLILGISAIVAPAVAKGTVASLIGWLLTLGGVAHLSIMVSGIGAARLIWQVIHGTIYAIVGICFLIYPAIGVGMLALLLSVLFLTEGVLEFIAYFRTLDESGAVWLLVNGLITLLLGGLISIRWPSDSGWAISSLVGANLVMRGVCRLMSSMAARQCVTI